jgi:hypothetical protein
MQGAGVFCPNVPEVTRWAQALVFFGWYGSGPMLGWLVERKINPHIPVLDKAGRDKAGRTNDIWSSTDFEWDVKKTNTSAQRASL